LEIFPNCFTATWKDVNTEDVGHAVIWEDDRTNIELLINMFRTSDAFFTGYNSIEFDDQIMAWLLDHWNRIKHQTSDSITKKIFALAQKIIERDYRKYKYDVPFNRIDLMEVANLRKSLKMVAINLKWPTILEFTKDWRDPIFNEDELKDLLRYNLNDVEITEEFFNELKGDINLRAYISTQYGVDVITKAEPKVADSILKKLYEKKTGIPTYIFTKRKTIRESIDFKDLIDPDISFSMPQLKRLLADLKDTTVGITETGNGSYKTDKFEYKVRIGNLKYTIAKGGLHSDNDPDLIRSTDQYQLIDADVTSYYPYLVFTKNIYPEHLGEEFVSLMEEITKMRVKYKHSDEEGSTRNSDVLKIVINATYGKFGDAYSWLYDPAAMYAVTLNGQLELLYLIEMLESNEFEVVYANTDGVTAKVPNGKEQEYESILNKWQDKTQMVLEKEPFKTMAIADVNNLIVEKQSGSIKRKGRMNKDRHKGKWGIGRSFHMPVVAKAAEERLLHGVPVEETIRKHKDLYDFCMAQRPGKQFDVVYKHIENNSITTEKLQRSNRYYVAKRGGVLLKKRENGSTISMVAGEHTQLLNEAPKEGDRSLVKERYYINEAKKLVIPIENRQLKFL